MMLKVNILILFLLYCFVGCSGLNNSDSDLSGEYNFTMYDSLNLTLASGTLVINEYSSNSITGKLSFTNVVNEFEGYESIKKEFTGKINEKEKMVLINTNPGAADNNVYFNLKIKSNRLDGDWYYTVLRQEIKYNRIVLIKK